MTPSERLKTLRDALRLTQRELAREFRVSHAAIAQWEAGLRPVPGPVARLIELYAESLGESVGDAGEELRLRRLSVSWSERLLTAVGAFRPAGTGMQEKLRRAFDLLLASELSRDSTRRRVQLLLLERLVDALSEMRGLPMKFAQMLTYMRPGMPAEVRRVFQQLEHSRKAMPPTLASRVVFEELGESPKKLFAEWDPRPFAVASIGQVHRARLRTGELVAVKLQHPDVRRSVESDVRGFRRLREILARLGLDDEGVVGEICRALVDECDYGREAAMQEEFRTKLEGEPDIRVPRVFHEYSRQRILVSELVEGMSARELVERGTEEQRKRAAAAIWRFEILTIMRHDLVNTDAYSGNFIFTGDAVAFIDFGRAMKLDPAVMANYRDLLVAMLRSEKSAPEAVTRMGRMGMIRGDEPFDHEALWQLLVRQQRHAWVGPFRFTHEYIHENQKVFDHFPERKRLRLTADAVWAACESYGAWSLLADLGVELDYARLAREIVL